MPVAVCKTIPAVAGSPNGRVCGGQKAACAYPPRLRPRSRREWSSNKRHHWSSNNNHPEQIASVALASGTASRARAVEEDLTSGQTSTDGLTAEAATGRSPQPGKNRTQSTSRETARVAIVIRPTWAGRDLRLLCPGVPPYIAATQGPRARSRRHMPAGSLPMQPRQGVRKVTGTAHVAPGRRRRSMDHGQEKD